MVIYRLAVPSKRRCALALGMLRCQQILLAYLEVGFDPGTLEARLVRLKPAAVEQA